MPSRILTALLLAALSAGAHAQSDSTSLGDVARQNRNHGTTATAKHVWNDDSEESLRTGEDVSSPCGAPLPNIPVGSTTALLGKSVPADDAVAKSLLKWMQKHPDLDAMSTDDLSKMHFARTPQQLDADHTMATQTVARWVDALNAAKESGTPEQTQTFVSELMSTKSSTQAAQTLEQAIRIEQERRVHSDGSPADKIQEAVNLYSICETRHLVQTLDDVDTLAKAEFRKRLAEAVKTAGRSQ
jgi:hypothetical protein